MKDTPIELRNTPIELRNTLIESEKATIELRKILIENNKRSIKEKDAPTYVRGIFYTLLFTTIASTSWKIIPERSVRFFNGTVRNSFSCCFETNYSLFN